MIDRFLADSRHSRGEDYDPMEAVETSFSYDDKSSPLNLSFTSLSAGFRPPRFFETFHYLEIASTQSLTTLIHAVTFPHGKFYLVDSNPIHVANIRELVLKMGLSNVEVVESNMEDILSKNLPPMDYVVSYDKLVRLDEIEEQFLVGVIKNLLRPGGLVYLSYDSLPYWASYRGVIHLMRLAFERSMGTYEKRALAARQFLEEAIKEDAPFTSGEKTKRFYKEISQLSLKQFGFRFLLSSVWRPRYFSDVGALMSGAKMVYLTSANRQQQIIKQGLPQKAQEVLESCTDPSMRELLMDTMLNHGKRWDVFGKGSIRATATDLSIFFERMHLYSLREREHYVSEIQLQMGRLAVKEDTYQKIYDEVDKGDSNLLAISRELGGRPSEFLANLQGALLLENIGIGVEKQDGELARESCRKYNKELLSWSPDSDYHVASPFLCVGMRISWLELHAMTFLEEKTERGLSEKVYEKSKGLGGQFQLNGESVESADSFYEKTGPLFQKFLSERRSSLVRLGIEIKP